MIGSWKNLQLCSKTIILEKVNQFLQCNAIDYIYQGGQFCPSSVGFGSLDAREDKGWRLDYFGSFINNKENKAVKGKKINEEFTEPVGDWVTSFRML